MKHNSFFRDRCLEVLKIARWSSPIVLLVMFVVYVQSCEWCVWEFYYRLLCFITDSVVLQLLLGLFVIPLVATFVLVFVTVLPFYRTPEERRYNRDRKRVRAWVSKVESLSSLADLSVEYFEACKAEQYSEQLVKNLQSRLQKLENISQCGTEGARVCSQCGAVLSPHSNICEYCGTSFAVKSGDVALSTFANDTKINEHIAKTQHKLALAEDDYKAKNLEERYLYGDVAELLDTVTTELVGAELVFVWNTYSYRYLEFYGNSMRWNKNSWIDLDVVDRVLGSSIKFVCNKVK